MPRPFSSRENRYTAMRDAGQACGQASRNFGRYALPAIGSMRLDEVRPRHLRDLVLDLRKAGTLASRTIRHVYATLTTMFRNAVADELILATPCVLAPGVLPKKVDKDPAFRANAIFTREELEQLTADPRILEDRRILYALKGLAALRHTEAATLRWDQYDTARQPLGCLSLEKTKTKIPRQIPVHPALAHLRPPANPDRPHRPHPERHQPRQGRGPARPAPGPRRPRACARGAATTSAAPSSRSRRSTALAAISCRR
jgi:integrase